MQNDSDPSRSIRARNVESYSVLHDRACNIFTGEPLTGDDLVEWQADRNDMRGKSHSLTQE